MDQRSSAEVISGWDEGISGSVVRNGRVVHIEHIWSTVITLEIPDAAGREPAALDAIGGCTDFFRKVDEVFSAFKPLSEVTMFRNGISRPGAASADFNDVMQACQEVRVLTRGAFDPWAVPGGYDPSGYVKGWAAGQASAMLAAAGFANNMVNAGGDIACHGHENPSTPEADPGWSVGILNPHNPQEIIQTARLQNMAMATSGRYERGDHVIDPRSGRPATAVDSATVVGPDAGIADAAASAVLVDGTNSVAWFGALGPAWSLHLVIGETAYTFGSAFDESGAQSERSGSQK